MKKACMVGIMFCAILSLVVIPMHNSIAEEINEEESTSYLTFLFANDYFNIDVFTFGNDGTFTMQRKDGTGTYDYFAPLFEIEWTSTDGDTIYNFTGVSIMRLVIIGWEDEVSCSTHADESDCIFFVGISNGIISD